ncbi:MAG: heme-copper oxidase subunit III [Actinomycetota bacterium]|jgi:cytochrome c oxidase subunit 3/cytochrome o ubiquinol oxidase subunit 3|nr:heme-copper oxidase subunit III [Actinomycetota bacterium]
MSAQQTDMSAPLPGTDSEHSTSLGLSNNKMAMWTFIGSECLFFGALISTYLIYVGRTNEGPTPAAIYDVPFTSVSTFILLMSSLGMVLALAAIQAGEMRKFRTWILATGLMGATFLAGQFYEFTVFAAEQFNLTTSPFSSSFFVLTGFHGLHVALGILMLLAMWTASMMGRLPQQLHTTVENIGLYWHFVDIVWIIIFTVVYLIPAATSTAGG